MAFEADGRTVLRDEEEGNRAAVQRRVRGYGDAGDVRVRLLRAAAVQFGGQVSFGIGMAELLPAHCRRKRGDGAGHDPRNGANRGALQPVRRALGACV